MAKHWSLNDAESQAGRVAIVTGANTGLGYETALALAAKGARVIMACRDEERATSAMRSIRDRVPEAAVEARPIDTSSLRSVRSFADGIQRDFERLDLLINNAGIMITPYFKTEDGFEGQLGVNYLGHFLLTGLLLPMISSTPDSRVVSLYSVAANWGGIQFDDLHFEKKYNPRIAYSQSKMACLMFGLELDERLKAAGHKCSSMAAHPGFSQSDLSRHLPAYIKTPLSLFASLIMQPTAAGALPTLYAALGRDLQGGEALGPSGRGERKGPPKVVPPNPSALNRADRARLWELSESLVDFSFGL